MVNHGNGDHQDDFIYENLQLSENTNGSSEYFDAQSYSRSHGKEPIIAETDPVSRYSSDKGSITSKANDFSFMKVNPVSVNVRNLSVSTKGETKLSFFRKAKQTDIEKNDSTTILHETSFDLPCGSLMAIIGGSGSGKTTLLNVLSQRSSKLSEIGVISFNGTTLNKIRHAYVIQQDILSPNLTARETLRFATELRLPDTTNKEERLKLVEEVISELGLKDCADTIIGDSAHKGLSGGEKRRLSIGIQILSNPSLLFLDEPTTGLDAHSAFLLIKTLKNLTKRGRTIIISIHQPRSDIFFLFDYLTILSRGRTVYSDKVESVLKYFGDLGYHVPENVNPADFLIDVTTVDTRTPKSEILGNERLSSFAQSWTLYQSHSLSKSVQLNEKITDENIVPTRVPFLRELTVLVKREVLLTIRDTVTLSSLFGEAILMGIICGWVFYKPKHDLSGLRTLAGALYSANGLQGYLMLLFEVYRLCHVDIKNFDRERADNCISVVGFLLSRRIAKFFTEDLCVTLFFSLITYFMFGLQQSAGKFFIYWTNIFLVHCTSMTGAMLAISVSRNFANASLLSNMNYTLQSFACGYFVNAKTMPVYVRWTKYIAYIWYGFGALISNEFTGFVGDCESSNIADCAAYTGKYIIQSYGFWENWIAVPLVVILAWVIVFYVLSGVILSIKKVNVSSSKQITSATNYEDRDQESKHDSQRQDDIPIDLTLSNICLSVKLKKRTKLILQGVDATFKSKKINAIMGPSGSGKSSLLNLISGRLGSDLFNKYNSAGEIFFNEYKVTTDMVNSICSYVAQDDDHLLSTLSVRETLSLAATLRIESSVSSKQKREIVENVINKLGLRNCANTLIGSEFIKGISGGEKRRVAIGIQLLSNPKILLLDEPTSGLDSFTAYSILEILQDLASEGTTVILTIHQPRSDIFNKFGQVLLLSKGGTVAYNGLQSDMVEFFSSHGYPCPALTNSADHVLDLISINNQTLEKERVSSERVKYLLDVWREKSPIPKHSPQAQTLSLESFHNMFGVYIRNPASFVKAFYACLRQFALITWRNKEVFTARFTNVLGLGVIIALYIAPLNNSYNSIQTRLGLVQEVTALYFCGMLNNLSSYPDLRNYFYHEYDDRVYGIMPFFISYTLIELPFEIVSGLIFAVLTCLACNLERSVGMFFSIAYVSILICFCGESLGIMTNTIFREAGFAVNTISLILSVGTFMAGIMSLQMNIVLKGFNYLSPLKYGVSILINMAFPDSLTFTCDDASRNANGECPFQNGRDVLDQYGLKTNYNKYFGVLLAVAVIYRFIAYALLRLKLIKLNLGVFEKPTRQL